MEGTRAETGRAFTVMDLLAALAGVVLLGLVILPSLAQTNGGSEVAVCSDNLRQIAQGWGGWGADHADRYPWQVPIDQGGAHLSPNAWSYFLILSNRLDDPKVFACPSDLRKPATHFGAAPGGLAWPAGGENNAVSYFVGLDTLYGTTNQVLTGDRHFTGGRRWSGCRNLTGNYAYSFSRSLAVAGQFAWTNSIHGENIGNLAFTDGSVQTTTSAGLNTVYVESEGDGNFEHHILPPY
jgi:hypothetical protein